LVEYLNVFIALAPIAYVGHMTVLFYQLLSQLHIDIINLGKF